MKLNISLDVEDIYGEVGRLNDILDSLCSFIEEEEIYADLYITGSKFQQLQATNPDLLTFIEKAKYLEVGYHSNTHSFHTIPVMTRDMGWDAVERLPDYEERDFDVEDKYFKGSGGISPMKESLTLKGFRAPNYAWTPQYLKYIQKHELKIHTMDIPFYEPFYFMDFLTLPVVSKPLEAMLTMSEVVEQCKPYKATSIFLHPSRILYDQFWDKEPVRTPSLEWKARMKKVKEIMRSLKNEYELIGLQTLNEQYTTAPKIPFDRNEASKRLIEAMTAKWTWSQLPVQFYSEKSIELCHEVADTFYVTEIQ